MPLNFNQKHKSCEEYFNLHHSVILLMQREFKISPLSSDKAGSFSFLEFLLIAPSLQPVAALPSCTILGTTREASLLLHGVQGACRAGSCTTDRDQHIEEDGETPQIIWETTAWTQADP